MLNKLQYGKNLIKFSDVIYNFEIISEYEYLRNIDLKYVNDEEYMMRKNRLCEKIAQCCEFYLKGLSIPEMIKNNNDIDKILNDRKSGIKNFGHNIKKLIFSNSYISDNVRYKILNDLSYKTTLSFNEHNISTLTTDVDQAFLSWIDSDCNEKEVIAMDLHKKLFITIENIIARNDIANAYQLSRYSSLSEYIGDVEFLYALLISIRKNIKHVYNNAYLLNDKKFIFPDISTDVSIINGNNIKSFFVTEDDLIQDKAYDFLNVTEFDVIVYIEDDIQKEEYFERKLNSKSTFTK